MPITNYNSHYRIPGQRLRNLGHLSMTPLYLYGISGRRWHKAIHISIFWLYPLRRQVLLSSSTHYSTSFSRTLHVELGQLSDWPSSEMAIFNGAVVESIAFSPNGQHIVSGSYDRTIRVWNAMTGEMTAGPFTGHTAHVNCGILTRWPVHRLRFRRSNNSCVECHD